MEGDDRSRHVQMEREKELEFAVHKRDEVIQQLSVQLQHLTAHNYSEEATHLAQQVQILQTQLQHAGKVLQSQTDKQAQTSHALQDATQEIVSLQQTITDKDSMMNQLAERLDLISQEYTKLKESHETTKLREKQTNEVVQKLMMDAELMRKQKSEVSNSNSMSGPSSPTSPTTGMVSDTDVEAKMEALRSELEERYGLHFAQMKQAVVQQYQEQKVTLDAEMGRVKAALENAMRENADYHNQLQHYMNTGNTVVQLQEECNLYKSQCDQLKELLEQFQAQNDDYCRRLQDFELTATNAKELQDECALYKSQNDELKNKINSQQDSVVSLQSALDNLTSENSRLRDQMNLLSQDLDSQNSEIEEAFLEKSQYIEKARILEEEVGMLKSEKEDFKSNCSKMEDMISSLKEGLNESETSRQRLESAEKELGAGIEVAGVTVGESTDETGRVKLMEEASPHIDNVLQTALGDMPGESGTTKSCVQLNGQSAMCVQEEITLENASLAHNDQTYNESSVADTKSLGTSSISLEHSTFSGDSPNDSEATLTNDSCNASANESSQQSNSVGTQNLQYVSQIEALKADMARLLDERTFALSEIEKLSDEIMVLKEIGNKSEVELRELDHIKSENEVFQREREEHIESNLTLMADVHSAHLVIENLEEERTQLLASNESLEENSKEMNAKYEDVSVINQRLIAELESVGQEKSTSVLSRTDSRQGTSNSASDVQQSHVTESDSSASSEFGSGQSSHTDSDNASRLSSCQSSLQGQLSQFDNNHLPQFDRSFFFGRQEEVPMQAQEQSTDLSHTNTSGMRNISHSAKNQSVQTDDENLLNKLADNRDMDQNKTKGDNHQTKHTDLEQEIVQMQTHVDDLHTMRANLQEHIEHLKKEAKTLEKSTKKQQQDLQASAESLASREFVTDISHDVECELVEKNKTLLEEKDLLARKVSALEWQVTELKTENKKNTDRLTLPVEELMVQNFQEVEEAVDGGSHDPWTKQTEQRSLSSQDSIEQEIMVQDSQNSMAIRQEVVEDMVTQTGFQITCAAAISSRMSPDSIDQLDNDDGTNDISSDSIEEDVPRPEGRQQERVRNSQCMLSVVPSLLVPSYSGGADNSLYTKVVALDSASNDKSVDSITASGDPVDSNIGSGDHNEAKLLGDSTDSGDYSEGKLDDSCPVNNQGGDSASQMLAELEDTSPGQAIFQWDRNNDVKTSDILVLQQKYTESQKDIQAMTRENVALKERLHVLSENCDSLRTTNVALSSVKEEDQRALSSLQIECGALQEKVQHVQTENSDIVTKCETLEKFHSELEKDNSVLEIQLLELKENLDRCDMEKRSMSEVEDVLKLELETLTSEKVVILADLKEREANLDSVCVTLSKAQQEAKCQQDQFDDESKTLCTRRDELVLQNQILQQQLQDLETKYSGMEEDAKSKIDVEHDTNKILKEENSAVCREKEDFQISLCQLQAQKEQLERQLELSASERQQMVTAFEEKIRLAQETLVPSCVNEEDLTNLKKVCCKLNVDVERLNEENTNLSTDNEKLKEELESKEKERKKLAQSLEENKAKFIRNKAKLVKLEKTNTGKTSGDIQQLENLLKNKEDEKQELKDKMENVIIKMVNDNTTLKETLELTMDKLRQEKAESEQMKATVEGIMKTNSELLEQTKNTNTDIDSLKVERSLAENSLQILEKQRASSEKELEELTCSLDRERCRVCELEAQCQELKTAFEKAKEDLNVTEGMLEKQCEDLKTDLEKEKSNAGMLEKQCEDLKIDLEKERTNVGMLEKQCEDLKTDLEKEKCNSGMFGKQCEDFKTNLEKDRSNVEILEKQCEDFKTDLEKERTNAGMLEKQFKDLKTDLEKEKSNAGMLEKECEDLKTDLEKERENAGMLEKQCEDLKTDLEKETTNAGMLEKQCEDLKTDLNQEKSNAGMLEKQCEDLKTDLNQERSNAGMLEKQCEDLKTYLEKERTNAGMLEKQCEDLKTDLGKQRTNAGMLEKQCEDLKTDLEKERTNAGMLEKQCEDLKTNLKTDLEKERTNAGMLEKQCEDLKTDLNQERSNAGMLEKQCEDLKTYLEKERTNAGMLEKQCEDLKTDLEKERTNAGMLEKQCEDLKTNLKTDLGKERTNAGMLEKQCKDLKTDLEKERTNAGMLEKQCEDLKTDLEKERTNAGMLEKQCEDFKTDLEKERNNAGMLGKQCEDLKTNIATLQVQIKELEDCCERARTEGGEREAQCHHLQNRLEKERTAFNNEILSLNSLMTQERDNNFEREETFAQRFDSANKELETMRIKDRNYGELKVQYSQLEGILEALTKQAEHDRESHEMEKSVMIQSMEQERTVSQSERLELVAKCEKLQDSLTSVEQNLDSLNLEYQTKFHDYCLEKEEFEKDIESQRSELEESWKERVSLKEQCEKLKKEKSIAEEGFTKEQDVLLSEKQSFTQACHQMSAGKEQLEDENQRLEHDKLCMEGEIKSLADKIQHLQGDKQGMLEEKQCLEEKLMTAESELKQQRKQELVAQEKFESTKHNLELQMGNLRTDLEMEIEALKTDKKDLGLKYDQELERFKTDKAIMEQKGIDMEKAETVLQSELTQWKEKYSLLEGSILEMLSSHGHDVSQHDKDISQLIMKHSEDIIQMKSHHDKEIESMKQNCEKILKDSESLRQEGDKMSVKFGTMETETEGKVLEMKEEIRFLCGQVEELQTSLDENVRKHLEEKQILENLCKELQDEITIKQERIGALDTALDLARNKYEGLETMHQEVNQVSNEKMESTNKQNMALIENYKQHVQDLEEELKVLHKQVKDSDEQNIEMEKSIESFQEELTDLTESKDFYQAELASATENLRLAGDVRQRLNTEIESLKSEVDTLTLNKQDLLSQVESLKNNMTKNDSMGDDFLRDLKSLTAERDGEVTKNKELMLELKHRNERCEKLILAREQLLQELDASEQLRTRLENENENVTSENKALIQECATLKELEQSLTQDLKQKENRGEQLTDELNELRNHSNELHLEKVNVLANQEMLVHKNQALEAKNESLVQEIAQLKETLPQFEQERDELLNLHEAMAEDLSEMQHKYETVQSLMEDTKKECNKEIEKLQVQLRNVNTDMTAMKSSLQLLEDDLNLSHDQKASLVLRLTQEETRFHGVSLENPDDTEESCKSQKDIRNQRVASGSQRSPTEIPEFMEGLEEEQDAASESGFFQVESLTDADTIAHYERCINNLTSELECAKLESKNNQESYQEEVTKLNRKIEDLEKMKDIINLEEQSLYENEASESSGLLPQVAGVEGTSLQQGERPSAQEKEDDIEARVEECMARRMEGMKYEMEEKVALQVRSKEAETADKYDKEFKKYKKDMEVYMKHKFETIRAEKDTAFIKAMQKVNKDADKRVKKELERQRLKLLEERANEAGDGSTNDGRSQIGEVVQQLHQENQDLAEARDTLLQQVALSHHNQERLQEELRIMRGDEDCISGDFPGTIPGDSVVSEGGDYIQESDIDQSKFSHHLYGSTSLMFDWELSPQVSFDYGRDEGDALEFVEHFECRRPRCRLIRQKFQELYDALPDSGSASVIVDPEEEQSTNLELQMETKSKEGSFHPEENHASDDQADSFRDTEPCNKHSAIAPGFVAVIESMESKVESVNYSTTNSGFFLENKKDNLDDDFLQHDTGSPVTEGKVLTTEGEAGFEPEEGFEVVGETEINSRHSTKSEFLPEGDVGGIDGEGDMEDFIVDDVFESSVYETMYKESESGLQINIKSEDKTLDGRDIVPENLPVCDNKPPTEADRFTPDFEFHMESSPTVQRPSGQEVNEGFTREADEFENEDMFEAGDGFKPEKDGFSLDQELVGDMMPITPTSELESELVREALRNAAQFINVAPPYIQKKDSYRSVVPEKVDSSSAKEHQAVKRSKSTPTTDGFIAESDETGEEKLIGSVDCVMMLTAASQEGLQDGRLHGPEPFQGSSFQPKPGDTSRNSSVNMESRNQAKTKDSKQDTELDTIQRLRIDKKSLEEKVASLLKEKQSLTDKQREISLQLENETLSRQHFEQELMGISDNFERLSVKVTEPDPAKASAVNEPNPAKTTKSEIEPKCEALQSEISSLEASLSEKEELLKVQRQNFYEQNKSLIIKVKDLEESLISEHSSSSKAKSDFEQEISVLYQRIVAVTSVLEQDEGKLDLDSQVDSLESQVKELVTDKNQLQLRCKDFEGMLRETQMVALKEKTELDKELESIEGRTLMLTSANQDLKAKCVEMSNQQTYWAEEKKQLLDEKFAMESHLDKILLDHQQLQTTCCDLEDLVQRSNDASATMEMQLKILEDSLCEMTAAKQELHLRCMELENRLKVLEKSSELEDSSRQQKGAKTEGRRSTGATQGVLGEESGTKNTPQDAQIEELEKHLKEKENYIHKLEKSSEKQKDFMRVKSGLEQTLREKDNYIRKLEEHFLRQGPLLIPTSGPSMAAQETVSEDASSSEDSVIPQVVVETVSDHNPQCHSTTASVGDDQSEHPSDLEMQMEDLADQSLVSVGDISQVSAGDLSQVNAGDLSQVNVGDLSQVSVGDMNKLSSTSSVIHLVPEEGHFGSKQNLDQGPKLVAAISNSSPIASPRIVSPHATSTSSYTGSFNSSERLQAGFITEDDGHLETKHSELVDEIARLRKDLSETQAIYTKENVLLQEALDKDGSSRDATRSKSSVSSTSFDSDSCHEVTRLRQKVGALEETNKMLQIENARWLRRIQEQEQVVIELRELLGRDVPNSDNTDSVFGKQITLLQNQRDHLLEKIHDFEMKNQRLTRKLGDNSILEESLRREKDLLYAKLCEKEDLERELSEKRLALEKQRHSQEQLEEILYHKNITEKELMRQKRLLEEELSEIESKLQEKEELLERQKNSLLRDIKRRGSSPPKLLSGSFSVALNDDGSPASSTFYLEGTPTTSTPKKTDTSATPRELGRLELQVQEAERQHASAIQNLRQSLSVDQEGQERDTRQRYRGLVASLRTEHLHKVPES